MNQMVQTNGNAEPGQAVAVFRDARLPYHPAIEQRFGIDKSGWKALTDAIFPLATSTDSIVLALSYCRARKLDPFKRAVHIVPVWSKEAGRMVDTVWPGIGELRTTAFRTGLYAGRDDAEFGPDIASKLGGVEVNFPEWCRVTVYRICGGERRPFAGPKVYWMETYATAKRDTMAPNSMWQRRPRGQIEKCAEAAALRSAFPEEIGDTYAAEEMDGQALGGGEMKVRPERAEPSLAITDQSAEADPFERAAAGAAPTAEKKAEPPKPTEELTQNPSETAASEPEEPPKELGSDDDWATLDASGWLNQVYLIGDIIDSCTTAKALSVMQAAPKWREPYEAMKRHAPKSAAAVDEMVAKKREGLANG